MKPNYICYEVDLPNINFFGLVNYVVIKFTLQINDICLSFQCPNPNDVTEIVHDDDVQYFVNIVASVPPNALSLFIVNNVSD